MLHGILNCYGLCLFIWGCILIPEIISRAGDPTIGERAGGLLATGSPYHPGDDLPRTHRSTHGTHHHRGCRPHRRAAARGRTR